MTRLPDAAPKVSVVICAHNPDRTRLQRVLNGLAGQSLDPGAMEVLLVDNASTPPLARSDFTPADGMTLRIVPEHKLGLSHARSRGFLEARARVIALVDDDNLLHPDYLDSALAFLDAHPGVAVIGGPCVPEFDGPVEEWTHEFFPLLALRDLGPEVLLHEGIAGGARHYPRFAPTGAGMVIRTQHAHLWQVAFARAEQTILDRRGNQLTSAGDNDIVLTALHAGAGVAYVPALRVTHLLSTSRVDPGYLARLNEGIQNSWMRVLHRHGASPWPPISRPGAWLRIARAWLRYRAWKGAVERIRFAGAKGHFLGRCP